MPKDSQTAIDIGCGIGRVSKELVDIFQEVDVLEQAEHLMAEVKTNVPQIKEFYLSSIQDFTFEKVYDCILLSWVCMYVSK